MVPYVHPCLELNEAMTTQLNLKEGIIQQGLKLVISPHLIRDTLCIPYAPNNLVVFDRTKLEYLGANASTFLSFINR